MTQVSHLSLHLTRFTLLRVAQGQRLVLEMLHMQFHPYLLDFQHKVAGGSSCLLSYNTSLGFDSFDN